jgi:hypothetical protein
MIEIKVLYTSLNVHEIAGGNVCTQIVMFVFEVQRQNDTRATQRQRQNISATKHNGPKHISNKKNILATKHVS